MRSFAIVVGLGLSLTACMEPLLEPLAAPEIEILSPPGGTLIDHHGTVPIDVRISGEAIDRVELALDGSGTSAAPRLSPPLPADGDCRAGCVGTLAWDSDAATIGAHVIELVAYDRSRVESAPAPLALRFDDKLAAAFTSPIEPNHVGAATITVEAAAHFRGDVQWVLVIDGDQPLASETHDCRAGCVMSARWDTRAVAAGAHRISFTATDARGEVVTGETSVVVGDVAWASAIRVTGEVDGWGVLEIELHLEDATTGEELGCTGMAQGMEGVDASDVDYAITATFVRPDGFRLDVSALGDRMIRVHAIEDDELPCPGPITEGDDDLGRSAAVPASQLATVEGPFDQVVHLTLNRGRPYQK